MNRRNFFKAVTGFVAGIFVGSAKAKPQLTVAMLQKVKKDLDEDFDFTPSYYMPCLDKGGNLTDNWQLDRGKWRHVVLTNESSDKPILVYLDGKLIV